MALYVGTYAAISVFLFVQAVIALKPRATALLAKTAGADRRLRHFGAIASQTLDGTSTPGGTPRSRTSTGSSRFTCRSAREPRSENMWRLNG